jgi:dihydrofolate reductase
MRISLIVAMDKHRLIGNQAGMPWHLPADLRRFRKLTTGKPIIMGRKTYEHIGRPLPERFNIVVSRQADYQAPDCNTVQSLDEALALAFGALPILGADEILVIGGGELFQQALPMAERIYLTVVDGHFTGSAYFPASTIFRGVSIHDESLPADQKNRFPHRFIILDRNNTGKPLDHWINGGEHSACLC